jgi:hypothetical protein
MTTQMRPTPLNSSSSRGDRNPSPHHGSSSDNSEVEEPWDEHTPEEDDDDNKSESTGDQDAMVRRRPRPRPRNNGTTKGTTRSGDRRRYDDDDDDDENVDDLDDGDLPALGSGGSGTGTGTGTGTASGKPTTKMGGRIVAGQRTTTRPLSPPSQAGLVDPPQSQSKSQSQKASSTPQQKQFWNQLDPPSPESETPPKNSNSSSNYNKSSASNSSPQPTDDDLLDMPEDEMRARTIRKQESPVDSPNSKQQRLLDNAPQYSDEVEQDDSGRRNSGRMKSNVLDVDTDCFDYTLSSLGDLCGGGGTPRESPPRRTKKMSLGDPAEDEDQHNNNGRIMPYGVEEQTAIEVEYVDPNPRVAAAAAAAKAIKEDEEEKKSDAAARTPDGFTPQRKNAYLKAMADKAKEDFEKSKSENGGTSNRKGETEANADAAGTPTTPDNLYSSFNATEKRKFLKLINSGLTPSESTKQVLEERETQAVEKAAAAEKAEPAEKAAAAQETPGSKGSKGPRRGFWGKKNSPKRKDKMEGSPPLDKKAAANKTETELTLPEGDKKQGVAGAAVARVPQASPSQPLAASKEGDEERFAPSGINFYDAVRRERDNSEDEEDDDDDEDANRSGRGKRSIIPNLMGKSNKKKFTPLGEEKREEQNQKNKPDASEEKKEDTSKAAVSVEDGQEDEAADEIRSLDDELLPPPPPPLPDVAAADSDDAMDSILGPSTVRTIDQSHAKTDTSLDLASPESLKEMSEEGERKIDMDLDSQELFDLDTYLDSTEMFGGANSTDHETVVSGKSYKTSGTAYTTNTVSTRTRRPGTGKIRLKKAKEAAKSAPKGWHESIQAAAANSNNVWDPQHGWVDYVDPSAALQILSDKKSDEKIRISLDGIKTQRGKPQDSSQERSSPVKLPFPAGWEKDRNEMMQPRVASAVLQEQAPAKEDHHLTNVASTNQTSPANATNAAGRPARPRGWVETMKAATAKLSMDGTRWDPELGWVGVDDDPSESVAVSSSPTIPIPIESDTQDFGSVSVTPSPTSRRNNGQPLPPPSADSRGQLLTSQTQESNESGAGGTERYIQIGESGSIKSHYQYHGGRDQRQAQQNGQEARNAPLYPDSKAVFGKLDAASASQAGGRDGDRASLLVNVVKKKVDKEDANLFPEQRGGSTRRSTSADLDDADNGSFGAAEDFSWDQQSGDSFLQGKESSSLLKEFSANQAAGQKLPRNKRDAAAATPTGPAVSGFTSGDNKNSRSFDSSSSTGKSIPKLMRPKRDTSPIQRKARSEDLHSPSEANVSASHRSHQPARSQAESSPSGIMESPAAQTPVDDTRTLQNTSTSPASVSSGVKLKVQQYELRASLSKDANEAGDIVQDLAGTAEWKSFLVKKVRAETDAAAAKQQEAGQPRLDRKHLESLNEADSLFASADGQGTPVQVKQQKESRGKDWERDSTFGDLGSEAIAKNSNNSSTAGIYPRTHPFEGKQQHNGQSIPQRPHHDRANDAFFEEISDISPIRAQLDYDSDPAPSESSAGPTQNSSFFKRLQACAGPILPRMGPNGAGCDAVPMSHLAFLRTNPSVNGSPTAPEGASRFIPPTLCGRPDVIIEEDEDGTIHTKDPKKESESSGKERSSSRSKSRSSSRKNGISDVSSVISDEVGAKTAYFEALAMDMAVSGSKKKRRPASTSSEADSSASSKNSEKWQQFLERKKASGISPGKSRSSTDEVSKAAEKYAAEKVEEMMEVMAERSRSSLRNWESDQIGAFPRVDDRSSSPYEANSARSDGERPSSRGRSTRLGKAAEDLAAARVEAMMQALSSTNLDEGEI